MNLLWKDLKDVYKTDFYKLLDILVMYNLCQGYANPYLKSVFIWLTFFYLQTISFSVAAVSRLETISNGMVSAATGNTQQLQMMAVYGSAVLVLLVLLNLVREKKRGKRLMALLAIQLLCNAVLIYHFT